VAGFEEAFAETARGMAAIMADTTGCVPSVERHVEVQGHDLEALLHGFLSEILYLSDVDEAVFDRFEPVLVGGRLRAVIWGCPRDAVTMETEIKAVTYHRLSVCREGDGWVCEVLFDI